MNKLYYGDNLDILREHIGSESVDLIYLDPPFKSDQSYNVIFREKNGSQSRAQIKAFEDTWTWDLTAEETYQEIIEDCPKKLADLMIAMEKFLGKNDMLAYLVMMAIRLEELKRVLKPTGSIYLHCDPTASHYLKLIMDAVFGHKQFRNEIIWHYRRWTNAQSQFQRMHDVILFYSKSKNNTFNLTEVKMSDSQKRKFERGWDSNVIHTKERKYSQLIVYNKSKLEQAIDEGRMDLDKYENIVYKDKPKVAASDVIIMPPLNSQAKERLGYPTQKPETLLECIIKASSNEGDIVLDPFCGCGTTVAVAEKLKRKWIGIDITHLAIALMKYRLEDTFGEDVEYEVIGEPKDISGAWYLAEHDRFQFESWALSLVRAKPTQKTADRGIDGNIYFYDDRDNKKKAKQIIVQVKSGNVSPSVVRDLRGVIEREEAEIGVLITLKTPTKGMRTEAAGAGFYTSPLGHKYPKLQILTIEELFEGKGIDRPGKGSGVDATFDKAERHVGDEQLEML